MTRTSLRHGCKINYCLKVGERLANGYHLIESLFLPVDKPGDRLDISLTPGRPGIRTRFVRADNGETYEGIDLHDNSLVRAYESYAEKTSFRPGIDLTVIKGIPAGGGLGGGSANAAALLRYLQDEAGKAGCAPLDNDSLRQTAASLGADIPFFLHNRPARVAGIGEKLVFTDNPAAGKYLLVICPALAVSTAWAYAELDRLRASREPWGSSAKKDWKNSADQGLTSHGHQATNSTPARLLDYGNDFEEVVFNRYPSLARLKENLLRMGAGKALLSGTGACLFAIFDEAGLARKATEHLAIAGVIVYSQRM